MKTNRRSGFTLLEIMIAVTIIGFLAGLAIPALMRSRVTTQTGRCVTNLGKIEAARNNGPWNFGDVGSVCVQADITPYFKGDLFPTCPASGTYTLNPVGSNAICSVTVHRLSD